MNAICYFFLSRIFTYVELRVYLIFIIKENLLKTSTTMQWIIYRPLKTDSKYFNSNRRCSYSNKWGHFWETWKSCFSLRTNYQGSFNCNELIHLWGIKNIEVIRKCKSWREKWNKLKHCTHLKTGEMSFWICIKKILKPKKLICIFNPCSFHSSSWF